ncbi:hypothetical protein ES707_12368 [subsurface metagenome]
MSLLIPTRTITDASANYPQGYHKGNVGGLPAVEPNLVGPNIKYGVTEFGIPGEMVQWVYDLSFPELAKLVIPTPSLALVVAEDHSGGGHPVTPSALAIPVPTIGKAAAATSVNACGGAVAHDEDGVDTDETAEANSAAINDMTLLQLDGAVTDWYALGYANLFDGIVLNVSTVGADITLDTFEYSKGGGSWGTLTPILNQLNNYESSGKRWFTFERPGDWATDTYAGIANKYWIKLKASAIGGGGYVQPKGAQAWILVYA